MDHPVLNEYKTKWNQLCSEVSQEITHCQNQCRRFWQQFISSRHWEEEVVVYQAYRKQKTLNELETKFLKDEWNYI